MVISKTLFLILMLPFAAAGFIFGAWVMRWYLLGDKGPAERMRELTPEETKRIVRKLKEREL